MLIVVMVSRFLENYVADLQEERFPFGFILVVPASQAGRRRYVAYLYL